jgi:hypothetical protein
MKDGSMKQKLKETCSMYTLTERGKKHWMLSVCMNFTYKAIMYTSIYLYPDNSNLNYVEMQRVIFSRVMEVMYPLGMKDHDAPTIWI